ncbi:MAG: CHAT domain-containing protein [Spirulina sp. DLM2.Bin59]|nr:MAG: CHAT domain-containing protein [Spirulina sp. DLM2.Bin59]
MDHPFIKIGILSLLSLNFPLQPTYSQTITPDGTGTVIDYQGQTYRITGGTEAGANLFHSFQQFGLNAGEIAQFLSQPGIENILGRVTGGDPSVINGLLQVTGSNANLYLMNPAGMIFGSGSSLDIPGSFTATTADRIGFDGGWFNAFGSNDYSALIGNPNQFSFLNAQPGGIINGGNLTTPGNISLIGGTVVNTGTISGDHVTLAAVPGTSLVRLAQPGMLLTVEVEASQLAAGITALDLPALLTGSGLNIPMAVNSGEVMITNSVKGHTVDLIAAQKVSPLDPKLIYTGNHHAPTVVLLPEDLAQPWAVNIIDWRADQPYDLLYGGRLGTVSSLILPEQEGVKAIHSALERVKEPIDELNIIAEGHQGNLWLGKTWLNHENIGDYQGAIQQWGEQLAPNAALLIYSCFTALGAIGEGFVNTLAELTGATVAASTNATGSENYGGDWQLEYRTGDLEILNPFRIETLAGWQGRLATFTVGAVATPTLASAITAANLEAVTVPHTIRFAPGITLINLTAALPTITQPLRITGEGNNITIQRDSTTDFSIFSVESVATIFDYLTITGGSNNVGAGIYSEGSVTLTHSTVSSNLAFFGGGIYSQEAVTLINSTVSSNFALSGGGIYSDGTVTLINSTISNNTASNFGGGIYVGTTNPITIRNSTIAFNQANTGGGLYLMNDNTQSVITNTIVAKNIAATHPDVMGNFAEGVLAFNLIGNTNGIISPINATNITNVDPLLGPLRNNGGPTATHALLPGSPALNGGSNALTNVTVDQRGNARIFGGRVDIGAYEFNLPAPPPPPEPQPTVSETCQPHCEDPQKPFSALENAIALQPNNEVILDQVFAKVESTINQAYARHLGLNNIPEITLATAQGTLQQIENQTGVKSGLVYYTFVPQGIQRNRALTRSLMAHANLSQSPLELAPGQDTDELEIVLITSSGEPILKRLGIKRREIVALANRFTRTITRPGTQAYLPLAQQLYERLILPLEADLTAQEIQNLAFIADAGLRFIPFAALHDGENFLIERYSLGLMPSLSLTDRTYRSVRNLPILAMGASEFTNQEPLPAVPLELGFITEEAGSGQAFLNESFTPNQFRAARSQQPFTLIHLGTHGEFKAGSPANSYIEFWQERLTLDRIRELGLHDPPVELLVLSACRTALGSEEAELGFAGLAVQAGVKSALGSLWYVSDAGTLGLMSAFYQQLQQAPIKAEALRQAQLGLLRREVYLDGNYLISGERSITLTPEITELGATDFSHPYYWSAFTMIGSPW